MADRESSLLDVASAIVRFPSLRSTALRMIERDRALRDRFDRVEDMARGVQGTSLDVGQNFGGEFDPLMDEVGAELEWEISEAIPRIRAIVNDRDAVGLSRRARSGARHAPTTLIRSVSPW